MVVFAVDVRRRVIELRSTSLQCGRRIQLRQRCNPINGMARLTSRQGHFKRSATTPAVGLKNSPVFSMVCMMTPSFRATATAARLFNGSSERCRSDCSHAGDGHQDAAGLALTGISDQLALRRPQLVKLLVSIPPCKVAMEAGGTARSWGRQLEELGHQVFLIPPDLRQAFR